jgi:hypothetical protein
MRVRALALAVFVLSARPIAGLTECPKPAPLYPQAKISSDQLQKLRVAVEHRPGTACAENGPKAIRCSSLSSNEIWWFTKPGHPAHPAASRGQVMTDTSTRETCLVRDMYFAGDEQAAAGWLKALKDYDERIISRFRAHPKGVT